jgi:hypothetical protein
MSRPDLDLERALTDLGAHLEYPATPDLATAVAARLREADGEVPAAPSAARLGRRTAASRLAGLLRPPRWRRLALAGLAVAVLAAAVLVASPSTREAVARRLGLRGVEIRLGGERPTPTVTTRAGGRLDLGLGQRVTLDEARRQVGFPVLVPTAAGFQQPDAVFVNQQAGGGQVHFVYRARPGLPASPFTDAGLLVTQFQATLTQDFVKKLTNSGVLEEVTVAGQPGYWFSGDPHYFTYQRADGRFADEGTRLAGNALVWQRGEQTLRLEGQLSKEEALRIAESMR